MFLTVFFIFLFLVDLYAYQAFKTATAGLPPAWCKVIRTLYWAFTGFTICTILWMAFGPGSPIANHKTALLSVVLIVFVSKLVIILFLLLDEVLRLARWLVSKVKQSHGQADRRSEAPMSRNTFLSKMALAVGALPFVTLVWGMARGAYSYQVNRVRLRVPHLPTAFQGFKILQISDLHTGSFRSTEPLQEAVRLINAQAADVIVFTGDLVNNRAQEVEPHIPVLQQIKAREQIYSILGNHDYGDYVDWASEEARQQNMDRLRENHAALGWDLLLNEHRILEKGGQQLAILGVENWSSKRNFPKYGKLSQAYAGTEGAPFKVLLSHDPSHWDGEVNTKYPGIDLTLSGHTHGMQFGVNLPHLKWSPVQYMYDQWAGLYQKGSQYLYVNTGLGFLGFPGRVGFLPEITVFELVKE